MDDVSTPEDDSGHLTVPGLLRGAARAAGLDDVLEKVMSRGRLAEEDGVRLYACRDIALLGAMANIVRERLHGNRAFFNRNIHINYTNICSNGCAFCAFSRGAGADGAFLLDHAEIARRAAAAGDSVTEVHMVGGVNSALPFDYYLGALRAVKEARPDIHVKAFTMVELAHMVSISGLSPEGTLAALREAGLDSCPGGGCEVLSSRVHDAVFPAKIGPAEWLDMQRLVHGCGLRTNATMLYGHVETVEERIAHMVLLRALQDETGGFQAFVPLAFHPANTALAHLPGPSAIDDLATLAVARLMLDNIGHIKAYWVMLTPQTAQVSLHYGVDDLDGTVVDEKITHAAGAVSPSGLSVEELLRLIRETGRVPVERDTLYRPVL